MKYKVNIARIGYSNLDIEVEADDLEQAKQKALDTAGNHSFSEHSSEYEVQHVSREFTQPNGTKLQSIESF